MSLWTVSHQTPLSMGFSRQEHWSGLPFPSPGDLPDSGIEPKSPALADGVYTTEPPRKYVYIYIYTHTHTHTHTHRNMNLKGERIKIQIELTVYFFMPLWIIFNFLREFHCTSNTTEFKFKGLCDLASAQLLELIF